MKRKILCLLVICFIATGCFLKSKEKEVKVPKMPPKELESKLDNTLENMTMDEKIGQMIMMYSNKTSVDDELAKEINYVKPGGYIFFQNNIENYEQVTTMIQNLKKEGKQPMLIGIDQEGGRVQRLKKLNDADVLTIPSMLDLGNTLDTELSYQVGTVVGEELDAFGFNIDFAPSLDIFSNENNTVIGNRAFGKTKEQVSKMAIPFADGLKKVGIIPVYKHFPGHGDTEVDSHLGLPVVTKTKEELLTREIVPYKTAFKSSPSAIMVAHIALPNITKDSTPATLSKVVITDWLRKELGFDGVVFSDAIDMKALSDNYSVKEIAVKGINAGIDVFIKPSNAKELFDAIKDGIEDGSIEEKKIDASVRRILSMKMEYGLYMNITHQTKDTIGSEKHQKIINRILKK